MLVRIGRGEMANMMELPSVRAAVKVRRQCRSCRSLPLACSDRVRTARAQLALKRFSVDLKSVLLLPPLCDAFRRYLQREHSEENYEFWAALGAVLEPAADVESEQAVLPSDSTAGATASASRLELSHHSAPPSGQGSADAGSEGQRLDARRLERAFEIGARFVADDCPEPVNLPGTVRADVLDALEAARHSAGAIPAEVRTCPLPAVSVRAVDAARVRAAGGAHSRGAGVRATGDLAPHGNGALAIALRAWPSCARSDQSGSRSLRRAGQLPALQDEQRLPRSSQARQRQRPGRCAHFDLTQAAHATCAASAAHRLRLAWRRWGSIGASRTTPPPKRCRSTPSPSGTRAPASARTARTARP
jgi:hypothetical protein